MSKERVLVFESSTVKGLEHDFAEHGGLITKQSLVEAYLDLIMPEPETENLFYMDRELAEKDPSYKQLIPYVILMQGREVFRYLRTAKGGESRLRAKHSVGLGGHINPCDGALEIFDVYWNGLRRELFEETGLDLKNAQKEAPVVGLLYDDSNEVGRVHFGVVHLVRVSQDAKLDFKDEALAEGHFQNQIELRSTLDNTNWENWSRLVIQKLL